MENTLSEYKIDALIKPVFKRRIRGLLLTYNCNLNCCYCYIEKKSDRVMSFETAQRAVCDAFKPDSNFDFNEVEVDFAGAEPLTAFERLKQISEWMWSRQWPKPYVLFATTNGTLLNDKMREWFIKNKGRISLGLSCDGNASTQNQNRSGSFYDVDIDFFKQTWPNQPVKMTISESTVGNLSGDIIYLHQKGFKIMANPANGMKEWSKNGVAEYGRQLLTLIEYYLQNPELPRSSLLSLNLRAVLSDNLRFGNKYCGAGVAYDVVDVDGSRYPCHMFSPMVQPEERMSGLKNIDFTAKEPFLCETCGKCILNRICPSCYGLNYKRTGNPAARERSLCRLFTLQALANCKYYAKAFRGKDSVSNEEYETVKAVRRIYEFFHIN